MRAEDCILLRDESVDSGSLNRCIGNLFAYIGEIESRNVDEVSENYPDQPFYKDGVDNALKDTGSVYHEYGITDSSYNGNTHGVVQRTYGGPLNLLAYRSVACRTESATGTYEYGNNANFSSRVLPNLESLHSPTYPLIFSSLVDDESAFEMANGVQTLSTTYFPTVRYTSYVLCSGIGVSFGTITFDSKNGTSQENRLRIDVRRDLVHIENARNIAFVSVSNGYASGIERISEDGDMVEDISPCTVTYLDRTRNDILVGGITKCDGGDRIRIDGATGRILPDDEESSYGETVELDNTSHVLSFFVVFEYRPPDVAFVNDAFGLGTSDTVTDYSRFMNGKKTIDGAPMTLDKFEVLDNYIQNQSNARMNNVRNVSEAFAGCSNATFSALSGISSSMVDMGGCFKDCTAATFESLTEISLSRLKSMREAFSGCTNATFKRLETINVPAAAAASAFLYCRAATFGALKSLTLGGDASYMFYGCANATFDSLETVDGHPSSTAHMFDGIKSATFGALKSLTLGGDASYMFYGCANATFGSTSERYADFNDLGGSLSNGSSMFAGCTQARIHIEDREENAPKTLATLKTATAMFSGCSSVEVDSLNPDGALVEAEDMFRGIPGGVSVKNLGRGAIQNARGMFRESHTVGISGGDVFNVADMGGMFMDVGTLTLTKQVGKTLNDNANVAMKADSAFRNVSSQVFKSYPNCAISNRLTDADYMFALDVPVEGDKLFEDASQIGGFANALTRRDQNSPKSNAVVKSSITTAKGMFRNRRVSKSAAEKLFANPTGGIDNIVADKYGHVLPVPFGLISGDEMYGGFGVIEDGSPVMAVSIPPTLASATDMFRFSSDNKSLLALAPVFSYETNDGDARRNGIGDLFLSDALHSNHSGMFDGAKFDNTVHSQLSMSVKDVHADYFAGSDFGFNGIAHFTDRSKKYWTDGGGDFQFFGGRGTKPRTLYFEDIRDDISKWFVEGVSLVNLFTPYPNGANGLNYRLVTGVSTVSTGSRGIRRAALVKDSKSDGFQHDIASNMRAFTPYATFASVEELRGDNMTCMFCPSYLVSRRDVMTYTKSANPEYFLASQANSATIRASVIGNTIGRPFAVLAVSGKNSGPLTDAYATNVDYPSATFKSLTSVCGVNMPFAFYGLRSATMSSLEEIHGDCANAVAAFADMPSATFDSLSVIDIKNPFTDAVQSSTSFSNNPSHWNGFYYRMFDGDVFSSFPKLNHVGISSSTSVHLERMFNQTGLDHIPDYLHVESSGDVFMDSFMHRSELPADFPINEPDKRLQMTCVSGGNFDVDNDNTLLYLMEKGEKGSNEIRFSVPPGVKSCSISISGSLNTPASTNYVILRRDSNSDTILNGDFSGGKSIDVLNGVSDHDRSYLVRVYVRANNSVKNNVCITSVVFKYANTNAETPFDGFEKAGKTVFAYVKTAGANTTAGIMVGHPNVGMSITGRNVDVFNAFGGYAVSHGRVSIHATGSIDAQYAFSGLTVSDKNSVSGPSGLSFSIVSDNGIITANNAFSFLKFTESADDSASKSPYLTSITVSSGLLSGGTTVKPLMTYFMAGVEAGAVSNLRKLYVQPCPFSYTTNKTGYYASMFGLQNYAVTVLSMAGLTETNIACLGYNREPTNAKALFGFDDRQNRSTLLNYSKLPVDVVYGMEWSYSDYEKICDSVVQTNGMSVSSSKGTLSVGTLGAFAKYALAMNVKGELSFGFFNGGNPYSYSVEDLIVDVNARAGSSTSKTYSLCSYDSEGAEVHAWSQGEIPSPCRITMFGHGDKNGPKLSVFSTTATTAYFDGAYLRHGVREYVVGGDKWYPADYVDMGSRPFDTGVVPDDRTMVELMFSGGESGCLVGCQVGIGSTTYDVGLYNDTSVHRITARVCGVSKYVNFTTETRESGRYTVAKLDLRPFTSYARIRNNATNANWSIITVDHSKKAQMRTSGLGTMLVGASRNGGTGFDYSSQSNIRVFNVVVRRDNLVIKRFVPVVRRGKSDKLDEYALLDVSDKNGYVLEGTAKWDNPPRRTGGLFDGMNYTRPK